ncbi:10884_t:CDS:2, partial [Ambispora gerdemannii]
MFAEFRAKKPKRKNNNTNNANSNKTKRTAKARRKFELFKTTFYQVLCTYNPDVVGNDEQDFLEYLAEQVWDEGVLQQMSMIDTINDDSSVTSSNVVDSSNGGDNGIQLDEQEIISKICEVIKDDFVTFGVCENDETCIEISRTCQLCHRHMRLSFHHLIPRYTHKKVLKRKLFTKEEVLTRGVMICGPCHKACHKMISHYDMAYTYNTLEMLRQHDGVI